MNVIMCLDSALYSFFLYSSSKYKSTIIEIHMKDKIIKTLPIKKVKPIAFSINFFNLFKLYENIRILQDKITNYAKNILDKF